ncbi:uncharacterized protein [Nicotiana tomentosiformis]|uniref:uncharacterized protein n=1 Tax=Nicotiana tomentosiformis TaxID=4098 RepID=UPI00388C9415
MAKTKLLASKLPHNFLVEAVNTACYIINRYMTRHLVEKTPYELLKGRNPNISHLWTFGCKCIVHNNGKNSLETSRENHLVVKSYKYQISHPIGNIITYPTSGIKTRSFLKNLCAFDALLSLIKPNNAYEALHDADWVNAMQDELNQFERSQVLHLVSRPKDKIMIGTKWVFRNKLDEDVTVTMNKARLVVQRYSQE